ncbi:hypothetical protein ACKI1I_39335 [Streptomyces turgidiscabies]|uniref:Putative lipoprotein n=1 Tax=Streptomyces turgidiscabies (strain Car8) TaxID=698760 RepID=L7F7Z1_STRT8|nr:MULTISPECIES: hypothetical protein [Streptomyces]ELP67126.1 putative lipoprotein [Streptomyces turgidiscabies Car8]MDX3497617.1 hypothetical protein [Streptomyces turgidiscabies]GAQ76089.1 hypothetical protein T45_07878 [Streptomyces turgidiscabies]
MKLRQTAAWAGFTAVALVAASGCGAQTVKHAAEAVDDTGAIMAALARATDRTEALGSAEVSVSTDLGNSTGPIAMEGTYSWGDGFAYDVEMDTKAAQMQQLQDDPTIHALFVDGDYYYNVDPQPVGPFKGKKWMKLDGSVVLGEKGAQAVTAGGGGSPTASMRSLKYAKDVEDLGVETLNGQHTTHYRAVIDQSRMGNLKDAYGNKGSLLDSATGGVTSIDMDVWVGAKNLPVRIKQKFGKMTVTMDFRKFGATADVKAPPAAQVADVSELVKRSAGKQG